MADQRLGTVLDITGQLDDGSREQQIALELDPNNADLFDGRLSCGLELRGQYDRAIAIFQMFCNGTATSLVVPIPGGILQPTFCGTPAGGPRAFGSVASQIAAFQKQYQADSPFNLEARNPNYVGSLLQQGVAGELLFCFGVTM